MGYGLSLIRRQTMTQTTGVIIDIENPTQHAMLIIWGHFGREIGLVDGLREVSIPQKRVARPAQEKLIEFLVGLLAGIEYLSDLSESAAPLMRDSEVAVAWGLSKLADASGVSRTLKACNAKTLVTLAAALEEVERPFLQRAMENLRQQGKVFQLDADLTGRPVSSTSTTFPDAAFGYMDGEIRLGYQVAEICLQTDLYGRQWLGARHHPGDTVSAPCLLELMELAERRMACHPRRRTELVAMRLKAAQLEQAELERRLKAVNAERQHQEQRITTLDAQIRLAQHEVGKLARHPDASRQTGVYSRFNRLNRQITGWEGQRQRVPHKVAQLCKTAEHYGVRLAAASALCQHLTERRLRFHQENEAQKDAPCFRIRVDAGFSSGENLTALIEEGYEVETKSANGVLVRALRSRAADSAHGQPWTRVGKNAEMMAWTAYTINTCPYPLTVGLERFHTPKGTLYAVLLRFQPAAPTSLPDLKAWFDHYNARQTIEAGNKEEKTTFKIQHLMCRSVAGIQIQAMLTVFAANFVRWADPWVRSHLEQSNRRFTQTLASPKRLIRVAANSPATVWHAQAQVSVRFSCLSSLDGVVITIPCQAVQPAR
jgi:hypothetical protein